LYYNVLMENRSFLIFISCLILIVGLMAMDFINPSLPYIMKNLSASQQATKGLMITYLIALSIAQLFYGTFSDNYGRRRAIVVAFVIAIGGFIVSALSRNIQMLYVGRFITALGLAGSPVISRALIADVCHDQNSLKKAFSYFAMFSQVSPALAPAFGGIIQHYASWRVSFVVLALINVATLIFLYRWMPESHSIPSIKKPFRQQLIVYVGLIKERRFLIFSLLSSLVMTFTLGFYSLSPFIFHSMGYNAIVNGMMCIPYAIGLTSGAFALGTFLYRFDSEKTFKVIMFSGFLFLILASVILYFYVNLLWIGIFAVIIGFMCGNLSALTLSLCLQGFQMNKGAASAVQAFIRYFFTGIGLRLCNFIELAHFYQLSLIFLTISLSMIIIYGIERIYSR